MNHKTDKVIKEREAARQKKNNQKISQEEMQNRINLYEKEHNQKQAVKRIQNVMVDFQQTLDHLQDELDNRKAKVEKIISQGEFEKLNSMNRGMVGEIGNLMWQWGQRSNQYRADLAVEYAAAYDKAFHVPTAK